MVVDQITKGFLPFCSLPSAFQVAEALFQNVFCYFGLPEDNLSNRGPQFLSRVWKPFFTEAGAGLTPFECALEHQPPLCPWDATSTNVPAADDWFKKAERVWEGVHKNIRQAVSGFPKQAD